MTQRQWNHHPRHLQPPQPPACRTTVLRHRCTNAVSLPNILTQRRNDCCSHCRPIMPGVWPFTIRFGRRTPLNAWPSMWPRSKANTQFTHLPPTFSMPSICVIWIKSRWLSWVKIRIMVPTKHTVCASRSNQVNPFHPPCATFTRN